MPERHSHWLSAIGYWLLAIGYWLLAIGYWLLAIAPPSGSRQFCNLSFVICNLSFPSLSPDIGLSVA
jgi:hypothetical protein